VTTGGLPAAIHLRILVLEDVPSDAELVIRELRRAGITADWTRVETEESFRAELVRLDPEIVLADYSLPGWNGLAALAVVRRERPELPFIVVTGAIDEETAADCIKAGADDYVLKERLSRLPHAVRSARQAWAMRVARREAERELKLRNSALEAAADAIVITDSEGAIAWANPAFTEMTGYDLDEVRGQNPRVLRSGVQREAFYRQMWETIKAGGVWRGELYNRRKDGTLYVEEMAITPVKGDGGSITHFVAIKQDVTQRKKQDEVIQSLATRDVLTGLPNQAVLREDIEQIVAAGRIRRPARSSCSTSTALRSSTTPSATRPATGSSWASPSGSPWSSLPAPRSTGSGGTSSRCSFPGLPWRRPRRSPRRFAPPSTGCGSPPKGSSST
jgi:PAS domain S-box-containing protein